MGWLSNEKPRKGEKVKLPYKERGKLTSRCRVCGPLGYGTCQCAAETARARAAAAAKRRPIPCGQRFRSGGTCHYTVAPGESCPRDHSRH